MMAINVSATSAMLVRLAHFPMLLPPSFKHAPEKRALLPAATQ